MADQMSLDGILDEKTPPPEVVKEEPKAPPEAGAGEKPPVERVTSRRKEFQAKEFEAQGRNPDGTYKAKEEPKEEPKAEVKPEPEKPKPETKVAAPQQEMTDKAKAFLKAAQEERQKRQDLERRLAALEQSKPKEAEKTFWDDPEGALKRQKEEFQQAAIATRLQTAEMIARSRHTDFDEKLNKFKELAETNPILAQQCFQQNDPAEYAYLVAKNHMAIESAGGVDQLIEKARAEERVKVSAELKAAAEAAAAASAKERAAIPGTLSDTKGTSGTRITWGGPTTLDSILHEK